MSNGKNLTNPLYSLEDYGIPTFGSKSVQEQREAFQVNQAAADQVARNLVLNRRVANEQAATDVYGTVLGKMYEGDRKAIEFMRNDIMTRYNNRQYARNPEAFTQAVSNLNALIDNAETFYADSYGNTEHLTSQPKGLGTGTTFVDAQYNSMTNNEALTNIGKEAQIEIIGYEDVIINNEVVKGTAENGAKPIYGSRDLFADANGTFEKVNSGEDYYDEGSMHMKDGELYVTVGGNEVRYQDLEHRSLGGLTFLPDLRDIGGQLEEHAKSDNVWAYISHRNGKWNEDDALDLFVDGMTNMESTDKAFRVKAWNSVAQNMGIDQGLRQTFIDTGNFGAGKETLFNSFSDKVKEVWLDATKKEEVVVVKPPKPPTQAEIDKANRRLDLEPVVYQPDTQTGPTRKEKLRNVLANIGAEDGFQGEEYAGDIMVALSALGINPSEEELAEGVLPVVEVTYQDLWGQVNQLTIHYPGGIAPDQKIPVEDTQDLSKTGNIPTAITTIVANLENSGALAPEIGTPTNVGTGAEFTLPGLYEDESKIIVASKEDANIDVEIRPNKVVFFQDNNGGRGDILIKNAFYDDGTSAGDFLIKKGSRNYDTAIKLLQRAIKSSYGEDLNIDMFFGVEALPEDTGSGANNPAP
jgi:hypothetical protein